MATTNIVDLSHRGVLSGGLTDLLRTGTQKLIVTAVEVKFA